MGNSRVTLLPPFRPVQPAKCGLRDWLTKGSRTIIAIPNAETTSTEDGIYVGVWQESICGIWLTCDDNLETEANRTVQYTFMAGVTIRGMDPSRPPPRSSSAALRSFLIFAPDHALIHPEHVDGGKNHTGRRRRARIGSRRSAEQDQKLADESIQSRQADRGQRTIRKERCIHRHAIREAAEFARSAAYAGVRKSFRPAGKARQSRRHDSASGKSRLPCLAS